ncbi:MAG: peptidase M28, partial [Gemmatimonadales bacterium]
MKPARIIRPLLLAGLLATITGFPANAQSDAAARLVAALLGDTPLVSDLQTLTDQIGGRATGSPANLRAVDWAVQRFRDAGVDVRKEPFQM